MDAVTLALAKGHADGLIEEMRKNGQIGYEGETPEPMIAEYSFSITGSYASPTDYPLVTTETPAVTLGNRNLVVFDGKSYICETRQYNTQMYIGNEAVGFTDRPESVVDTGEPFCIKFSRITDTGARTVIYAAPGTHTLEIQNLVKTVYPVSDKYLPGVCLPNVSEADNGRVMQVVDGKWQLGTAGGGASSSASVYGVSWDLVSNKLTRTDDAAGFEDPIPSVGGTEGSSPFDELMPWAGMQVVDFEDFGSFVEIPKFWYKVEQTETALNIQIADGPMEGFSVSPAHMDRGDGKGERDKVYVARYKCAGDMGASVSGKDPFVNVPRSYFRQVAAQSDLSITDYAMFWTTRMLMLVEYAVWDMQAAIGAGCGNNMGAEPTGATDGMPYHTGTIFDDTCSYGVGVQYRNIEDMWGNVAEFVDGWRMESDGGGMNVYVTMNPAEFSDTEGGVLVGTIPAAANGSYIKSWGVPDAEGYSWAMFPTAVADEEDVAAGNDYVADFCVFGGSALAVGGGYYRVPGYGPFVLVAVDASVYNDYFGARLQIIP